MARAGTSGLNYGWNRMEGFHCYAPSTGCDQTGLTLPVAEYGHDNGCAVIGGVVVRDPRQGPLDGGYLFGDSCSDNLWVIDPAGDGQREPTRVAQLGRSLSASARARTGPSTRRAWAPASCSGCQPPAADRVATGDPRPVRRSGR